MINPSAQGWIAKYISKLKPVGQENIQGDEHFYKQLQVSGFIFGHVVSLDTSFSFHLEGLTRNEISKVALLKNLLDMHSITMKGQNDQQFLLDAVAFYNEMNPQGFNLFRKVFSSSPSSHLEEIIDQRVQTNHDFISKSFSHIVTNALLFVDVLAFRKFLLNGSTPEKYLKKIEGTIISIISIALKAKTVRSNHDNLLIKLFESSLRYSKLSDASVESLAILKLDYFTYSLEKMYLLDLAGMTLWSDGKVEKEEAYFLYQLGSLLKVDDSMVNDSIVATDHFISTYKSEIPYFYAPHPVKSFYDNITQSVVLLINRNKKRLVKELIQSKELMILLAQSTKRDLDDKEKKKVKNQLLEICKTIPSLTIFLLPGGSLLLPIMIRIIPTMLPSAFNENIEKE